MLRRKKIIAAVVVVALLAAAYVVLSGTGALALIMDGAALKEFIGRLGPLGPLAIIGLIAVAIVINPIPSAPIALVAGAVYGHVWGTLYIALGSETGAVVAFTIARLVGYEVVRGWFGNRLSLRLLGSQNTLMAIVFATRLMPFVSFDIVSYAAGLTPLSWWRFAVATLAGIIPASFLLAHFGGEMASEDTGRIMSAVIALGAITLIPVAIKLLVDHRRARKDKRTSDEPL